MFTVCPKCGLMLVVTTADLKAAQGHVRCGRCRSVFNALESLSEETREDTPEEMLLPPPAPAPQFAPKPQVPPPRDAVAEEEFEGETEQAEASEDVWFEPDEPPPQEPDHRKRAALAMPGEHAVRPTTAKPPGAPESEVRLPAEPEAVSVLGPQRSTAEHASEPTAAADDFELRPARAPHTGRWLTGVLILLFVLTGQLINHFRGTLATMPSIGPKLRAAYGALGIPIVPLWNVHNYEARQLGAAMSADTPHQITVRASIANRGRSPLPMPLLQVTLQNRYGRTIAAREVPPRDYLSGPAPAGAMLPASGRIDATVTFVSPGPRAVGFEVDACLREGSALVCAHGPR